MDRACIHEGIRRMRFTDALSRSERSELNQMEAAELLGIGELAPGVALGALLGTHADPLNPLCQ
jgi:hypothetical protein